ncbi:MAG: DUF3494 domain-containing protein [Herminiimonas sp.]|nr:DUF3494 domain-containing protein [Herminiimonas sp.]
MKLPFASTLLLSLGIVAPGFATPLVGVELARFSVLAGGYATYGAGANVSGEVGATSYITGGAGSNSAADRTNTVSVTGALGEMAAAQIALNNMGTGTVLGATMAGNQTLIPGVYSASALTTAAGTILTLDGGGADNPYWIFNIPTYLVTGASTKIDVVNAGANASVVWNTGGYFSMGAGTSFLGTVMSGAYITQGAGSKFQCGNLFAASYVAISAGSHVSSTNCHGNATWAGSESGLGAGLDIVDGAVQARLALPRLLLVESAGQAEPVPVPEPGTIAMLLLGLGLITVLGGFRRAA